MVSATYRKGGDYVEALCITQTNRLQAINFFFTKTYSLDSESTVSFPLEII